MGDVSDSVNDVAGSGEPSFVHVAICTGTAIDGTGVTLVDRLCLNEPAVRLIADDMSICQQQQKAFIATSEAQIKEISKAKDLATGLGVSSAFLFICLLAVSIAAMVKK